LAADRMKPNELKRHLDTVYAQCGGKTTEFFHSKLNEFHEQNKRLQK